MTTSFLRTPLQIAVAITAISLGGCAGGPQLQVKPLSATHYTPTSLVTTLTVPPQRPYMPIAEINGSAPAGTAPAQVVAAITKRAAELGADAIILHDESRSTPAQMQFNPSGGLYQNIPGQVTPIYSAEAIHWLPAAK
ncbi:MULTISPECIES: hypothetical protein [Acidithiobacillus]|jgi:hypothetical protein|uniref:hypothetical protein n=1 Tax=Acidithiobacillus TaxID=119977 RepID=UPI0023141124|nr:MULTISPECIES: hypothetical protein [Acidithiobacillus]MBW9249307.1 hypothetical protein [Acidithiobacillus ferriphilus]MBW9255538.1 hypothetical protein [Acidithiobacillus ferriphilus]MDA8246825.1 hypothetical protein [Acidithiobacillus sp.]